jgi:hypothetical protein
MKMEKGRMTKEGRKTKKGRKEDEVINRQTGV